MVAIATRALTKVFPSGVVAIDGLDLDIHSGEFMVLLGPAGCGKSTLLRLIAGLEQPDRGVVLFDGRPVGQLGVSERNVAMVFQDYALYPHLSVAQNIGFPLHASHHEQTDVATRIGEAARHLGLQDVLNRMPVHLSSGQRQRVVMARAIVRQPRAFLLDEPLSNVDSGVRAELRCEIVNLARSLGVTTVYVTHDQTEAMMMADRVAVLRQGVLQQVGPPEQVYADPDTIFVAAFLGTPRTRLLEAVIYADGERVVLDLGTQVLEVPADHPWSAALARHQSERVTVALRADALRLVADSAPGMLLRGRVEQVEQLGHQAILSVDTGAVPTATAASSGPRQVLSRRLPAQRAGGAAEGAGRSGLIPAYDLELPGEAPSMGQVAVWVGELPPPATGDAVTLAVDLDRLLLFDRSGRRIRLS